MPGDVARTDPRERYRRPAKDGAGGRLATAARPAPGVGKYSYIEAIATAKVSDIIAELGKYSYNWMRRSWVSDNMVSTPPTIHPSDSEY